MKKSIFQPRIGLKLVSLLLVALLPYSCRVVETVHERCTEPIEVNTIEEGTNQNAVCPVGESGCNLRAALNTAAFCGGSTVIRLPQSAVFTLRSPYMASSLLSNKELMHQSRVQTVALPRIYGNVTIEGVPGFPATINLSGLRTRFFHISSTGNLTLRNVILDGGSFENDLSNPELGKGSAIINEGILTAENVTIINSKDRYALFNSGSGASSIFKNCRFESNQGALLVDGGHVTIEDRSVFYKNVRPLREGIGGSAIRMLAGSLTIRETTFEENRTEASEPIKIHGGEVTIERSLFTKNRGQNAGSINHLNGHLTVKSSTFYGDTSDIAGSINVAGSTANCRLTDVTIHGCKALFSGYGGITSVGRSSLTMGNTVISNNSPVNGGFIDPPNVVSKCLSTDESCPGFSVITNPNFTSLEPVDNGGPTKTLLPSSSSPLVDAGTENFIRLDQRGRARPFGSSAVDVGAVERYPGD